jgi:3-oxoacyl-[acyl-carrier protein] reductase
MDTGLEGKLVLVTGGAAGLGRAIALAFARERANLVLVDIDEAGLADTSGKLRALGVSCATHRVDLSVEAEVKALGARICAEHGALDVLVNNAGLAYGEITRGFCDLGLDRWLYFLTINSIAPLILGQALRPALARTRGLVINQSSMAANAPGSAYGVTKATLNSITYGMANQFASDGIRVNAVEPGLMETPANVASLPEETHKRIQAMQLLPLLHGTAEDIANLHVFLASDQGRFINNEIIACDAGNRLRGWRY